MKTIGTIESYLEGNLKAEELEEFRNFINNDSAFAEEVHFHTEINKSIADNDLQEFRILVTQITKKNSFSKGRIIKIFSSMAAAAVIVIVSVVSFTKPIASDKVFNTFYAPYQADLNTRSANTVAKDFETGYLLYQKGEYQNAFEILKKCANSVQDNSTANFYCGLCAMAIGKFDVTESSLQNVIEANNSPFTLHAKWYQSLLFLKTGKTDKSLPILKELSASPNFYSDKASQILKKLN